MFGELGGMAPSRSTLDRLSKTLSTHWEAHRADFEATLRTTETVPMAASVLAVSLDGVMAPMAKEVADQASPEAPKVSVARVTEVPEARGAQSKATESVTSGSSGKRHYREASCGTVTLYNEDSGRLCMMRYGRMPEAKKATLCEQLQAECQIILAVRPELKVVKLADGAEENWRFLDHLDLGLCPEDLARVALISILDFYHAAEHLGTACDVIWGGGACKAKPSLRACASCSKRMIRGRQSDWTLAVWGSSDARR